VAPECFLEFEQRHYAMKALKKIRFRSAATMKRKSQSVSQKYVTALRRHLKQGQTSLSSVRGLGSQALDAGLQTLDLARLHEQTLVNELIPDCAAGERTALIKEAGIFFAAAITPFEESERDARAATIQKQFIETLSQRTVELAAANVSLSLEIQQRKAAEVALKKSERHYSESLEQSDRLQQQLRRLSRQVLSAQENERKKISRELHDVIAQTLLGINLRLVTLKKEAALDPRGLDGNIARTQRLVESAVDIVHRFARELRPAMLDDLGLIPALHSFMKTFTTRTGVHARLIAFADVEKLDAGPRTVLFRVAQEALTNVARHARASRVEVTIQKLPNRICMKIKDDGKSFSVERTLHSVRGKRLGLLGMRERLEMIGGSFAVESAPGKGTTIVAEIPRGKPRGNGAKNLLAEFTRSNVQSQPNLASLL
jgi:signal transduction histidine kinase